MKNIHGFIFLLGVLSFLLITSGCELFYPTQFYQQMSKKTNTSGGPLRGGSASWKVIGTPGFTAGSPESKPCLKVDASGNPVVVYAKAAMGQVYLDIYSGGLWYEYITNMVAYETVLALSNNIPYIFTAAAGVGNANLIMFSSGTFFGQFSINPPVSNVALTMGSGSVPCMACISNGVSMCQQIGASQYFFASGTTVNQVEMGYTGGSFFIVNNNPPTHGLDIDVGPALMSTANRTNISIYGSFSMAANNGFAYITYQTTAANPLVLLQVDNNGSGMLLGGDVESGNLIGSTATAADSFGNVYVAAAVGSAAPFTIKVYTLLNAVWTQLGGDVGQGSMPTIDCAPDGTPIVAFSDFSNSSLLTVKAYR